MSASTTDILTAIKNIVTALNTASQSYVNVQGQANSVAITSATVVKAAPGRICSVSVIIAGSATGRVYDATATGVTAKPLYVIPDAVGLAPYVVNLPASFGIVVAPGTGQTVTVSYS
jgi:hypothetical protein